MRLGATAAAAALIVGAAAFAGAPAQARTPTAESAHSNGLRHIVATRFVKVASKSDVTQVQVPGGPPPGTITVEAPAFSGGQLYLVHTSALAGHPKVLRVDVHTTQVDGVWTDDSSTLSSLQFDPRNGRLYATDIIGGKIISMRRDGSDVRTVFEGPVDGTPIRPDDLSFDPSGRIYFNDASGTSADPTGRVIRLDPNGGHPIVLATGLASPNGIAFTRDYKALWVSEFTGDHVKRLVLDKRRTKVVAVRPSIKVDLGSAMLDSTAVDADGNVYQALNGGGKVLVWDSRGTMIAVISIKRPGAAAPMAVTNMAIQPGTKHGYLTTSGPDGGYLYRFIALGRGIRQSNGG